MSARAVEALPRVGFLGLADRDDVCRTLEDEKALVVRIERVGAAARGRLLELIDEVIERELDARGAVPPGIGSASDADAALSDQLFRARRLGKVGIALAFGPLRAALSTLGALEPEDGAALRFWARAAIDRPVWLFVDESDVATGAYRDPVALRSMLEEASDHLGRDDLGRTHEEPTPTDVVAVAVSIDTKGESAGVLPARPPIDTKGESAGVLPAPPPIDSKGESAGVLPAPPPIDSKGESAGVLPAPPPIDSTTELALRGPVEATAAPLPPAEACSPPLEPVLPARHSLGASVAAPDDEWRTWVMALAAARGPQSLVAFERLFSREYMPLANAISAGLEDPRALGAYEEFRRTFSRAYSEASPAFAATGKRPRMVLDAPDVAARIARLHGARSTQVLLVDAMRFDVGALIKEGVRRGLGARASLTDELVLWSALPTTTLRQLETLQRGAEALRAPPADSEREIDPLRGRTAEVIRRVKVGSRDLYKLDVVEARVREYGRARAGGARGDRPGGKRSHHPSRPDAPTAHAPFRVRGPRIRVRPRRHPAPGRVIARRGPRPGVRAPHRRRALTRSPFRAERSGP